MLCWNPTSFLRTIGFAFAITAMAVASFGQNPVPMETSQLELTVRNNLRFGHESATAVKAAAQLVSIQKQKYGDVSEEVAAALDLAKEAYYVAEDINRTATALKEQITIYEKLYGEGCWQTRHPIIMSYVLPFLLQHPRPVRIEFAEVTNTKLNAVKNAIARKDFNAARQQIDSVKKWIVDLFKSGNIPGQEMPIYAHYLQQESQLAMAEQNLDLAIDLQRQAVAIMRGAIGAIAPSQHQFYENLGVLLLKKGDLESAEFEFRQAVDCARQTKESPQRLIDLVVQLMDVFIVKQQLGDALSLSREVELFAKSQDCPELAKPSYLERAAYGRVESGQAQEGLALCQEAQRVLDQKKQSQSSNYGRLLTIIGHAQRRLGQWHNASQNYQQAAAIFEKSGDSNSLGAIYTGLVSCQIELKDLASAEQTLKNAESWLAKHSATGRKSSASVRQLRDYLNAARLLMLYEAREFPKIRAILDQQFEQYVKAGDGQVINAQMIRLERESLDKLEALSQLDYQSWLVALRVFNRVYRESGTKPAEILSDVPDALKRLFELNDLDDFRVPIMRYHLGIAFRDDNKSKAAADQWRLAISGWEKHWSDEHPHPLYVRSWYELGKWYNTIDGKSAEAISALSRAEKLVQSMNADKRAFDGTTGLVLQGDILQYLAVAYRWANQLDQAIATALEALELRKRSHGPKSVEVRDAQRQVAQFSHLLGKFEEAARYYVANLELRKELTSAKDDWAFDIRGLGSALAWQRDFKNGEAKLREAISLIKSMKLDAASAWELGLAERDLGGICNLTNRKDEGLKHLYEAHSVWSKAKLAKRAIDPVRMEIVEVLYSNALAMEIEGKPEPAIVQRQMARPFIAALFGEQSTQIRACDACIQSNKTWSRLPQQEQDKVYESLQAYQSLPGMRQAGNLVQAHERANVAIEIVEKFLGPNDVRNLLLRQELVEILLQLNRMTECIAEARRANAINMAIKGSDDELTAIFQMYEAQANWKSGKVSAASVGFQKARDIYVALKPVPALDYAVACLRLAECQLEQDETVEANISLQVARQILLNWTKSQPNRYVESLAISCLIAGRLGDVELAKVYVREAEGYLDQRNMRGTVTEEFLLRTQCLNAIYREDWQSADEMSKRLFEVTVKRFPTKATAAYGQTARTRARVLCGLKNYSQAETLALDALEIAKNTDSTELADEAKAQILLAEIYAGSGKITEAQALAKTAVDAFSKVLAPAHETLTLAREQQARIRLLAGDMQAAEEARRANLVATGERFERLSQQANDDQTIAVSLAMRQSLYAYLSLPIDHHSTEQVYSEILRWKGAALIKRRSLRPAMADPKNQELVSAWQRAGSALATEALRPPFSEGRGAWLQRLSRLRIEFGTIDSRMSTLVKPTPAITLGELKGSLPPQSVLIDMVAYPHVTPDAHRSGTWTSSNRYTFFVVRKDQPLVRIDVEKGDLVGELVQRWRALLEESRTLSAEACLQQNLPQLREIGFQLRELIWKPMEPYLASANLVIISPDGPLASLPFAALPASQANQFLVEEKALAIVPTPRFLLDSKENVENKPSLMVMGQVDYGASPGMVPSTMKASVGGFAPLTLDHLECNAVNETFQNRFPDAPREYVVKSKPTEDFFRRSAIQYRWLHISTHGFFAETFAEDAMKRRNLGALPGLEPDVIPPTEYGLGTLSHPGLQCGIGLAGANVINKPGQDDGILTALEVSLLDLSSVDSVVLSACQTALGAIKDGEGVLGLQRAFHQAGVRSVMATLWSVPVEATIGLLDVYYQIHWEDRLQPAYALQEAQRGFVRQARLAKPDSLPAHFEHPYFWAGFSLSTEQP